MESFTTLNAVVVYLDRPNVDTDAIIPKQFLKSIKRTGFGPYLFDEWRYLDHGEPGMDCTNRPLNQDFILNQSRFKNARILLTRENFGCGSSREHAPWALLDYGFKAIIGSSYADIFYNNCFKNGILPIKLSAAIIDGLFEAVKVSPDYELTIDLEKQSIIQSGGKLITFEIDAFRKHCLLNGLDDIGLTLQHVDDIKIYEEKRKNSEPWLFL